VLVYRAQQSAACRVWTFLLVSICVLFSGTALAQDPQPDRKFRSGSQITVRQNETIPDDLYASGGRVEVAGGVRGDLVAAGGQVSVTGTVDEDVIAAGGRIEIAGDVNGDARVAGGDVRVEGSVAEDVLVTGGTIVIAEGAEIGGDLVFSSGQMTLDGNVDGDVLGGAGDYSSDGSIGGSERVSSGRPEAGPPSSGDRLLGAVRRYIAIVAVGALLLWLAPRVLRGPAVHARTKPLPSLGVGALGAIGYVALVVVIVLAAVLLSIVLGLLGLDSLVATLGVGALLALALVTFAFAVVIAFIADAIVGLVAGSLVWRSNNGGGRGRSIGALALGVALVVIATAIPILGDIIKLLVVLVGLGALLMALRPRHSPEPTA
jgi:hypothetical protein